MSKVNEKRNQKIQDASRNNNWEEVSRLLDQPLENSLRKDRQYKTVSMNNRISYNGSLKEYGDNIADTNPNPLDYLITKENNQQLEEALSKLSEQERQIVLGYYVFDRSYSNLAKDLGISDKTVKKRLESTLQKMNNMLLAE
ncbi:sigma-70 family RNA polymerase sigma factor [Enterococcus faecalis]|uniref:sigma-70 family RNA polymerase sigma factor n=1 Tax=Enterococcus faecalis TaxID=1351 RepID=UPI0035E6639E